MMDRFSLCLQLMVLLSGALVMGCFLLFLCFWVSALISVSVWSCVCMYVWMDDLIISELPRGILVGQIEARRGMRDLPVVRETVGRDEESQQ